MGILYGIFGLTCLKTGLNSRRGLGCIVDPNPVLFYVSDRTSERRPGVAGMPRYAMSEAAAMLDELYA